MSHLHAMNPMEQLRAGRLPLRLLQLALGLSGYGFGLTMVIIVSAFVLALWIPLRQLPGLGTVVNSFWIGPVGVGTVAYAFGMGPVTQWFLRWCVIRLPEPKTSD